MFKDVDLSEALQLKNKMFLDVRSPGEFSRATVPGAVNVPLLDNVERSLVGTTYWQEGVEAARHLAMEIISPKLPGIVDSVKNAAGDRDIVIFCWRGGERSLFAAQILSFMGFRVYRVVGGFKAHRRHVRDYLERDYLPLKAVVLYGLTGVGKTDVLLELEKKGIPVLDLEGLSCHRGSVFGKIGMPPSPTQKMFEAMIVEKLKDAEKQGVFVVECESKRLGNLFVPSSVMNTMSSGCRVLLYDSVDRRTQRIKDVYARNTADITTKLVESINRLQKYIGARKAEQLSAEVKAGRLDEVIHYLLTDYYDPLYGYPDQPSDKYHVSICTGNMETAVNKVKSFILNLPEYNENIFRGGTPVGNRDNIEKRPGKSRYITGCS